MISLFINGNEVDLVSSERIAISLQVYDILSIDTVNTSFTKTVKLPKTAKNIKALQYSNVINSVNDFTTNKAECKLVINSVEVITSGYCYLESVDQNFNINIYFNMFKFFNDIEDKTLNELNLSDLNHYWNRENIFKLSSPPLSDDIQYPLVEWGGQILDYEDPALYDVNIEALMPMVSCNRILEQIIQDAGYTIGNTLDFSPHFEKLYMGMAGLKATQKTNDDIENTLAELSVDNYDYWYHMNHSPEIGPDPDQDMWFAALHFDNITESFFYQIVNMPHIDDKTDPWTRFRVTVTGKIKFKTYIKFDTPQNSDYFACKIRFSLLNSENFYDEDDGSENYFVLAESPLIWYTPVEPNPGWQTDNFVTLEYEGDFAPGDFVAVTILVMGGFNFAPIMVDSYFKVVDDACSIDTIGYGYWWDIATNLPNINQIDYIKIILQHYNLVMTKDLVRNIIYIRRFDDVFANIQNSRDWTNRLVISKSPILNYIPENIARKNWFKYSDPIEEILVDNQRPYDYSFDVSNAMLPKETDLIVSLLKPIAHVTRLRSNISVPQVKLINLGYQIVSGNFPVFLYINTSANLNRPSLIYHSEIEGIADAYIETSGSPYDYIHYVKAWFIDADGSEGTDLLWSTLITDHYEKYIAIMTDFRRMLAVIKLYWHEVQNFDFSIPVYFQQFGSFFYVNLIKDFGDGFATVELIKL